MSSVALVTKGKHVHALAPGVLQLGDQHPRLLIEHVHELIQDGEVEGGRQHLPPLVPLGACGGQKWSEMCHLVPVVVRDGPLGACGGQSWPDMGHLVPAAVRGG